MAQTVTSSASSYCTVAEFLKRVDLRTVGDWASDDGVRVLAGALTTDAKVLAALADASGELEAAALIGGKYTVEDLAALAATDCVGRAKLYRLISDLALCFLYDRRPQMFADARPPNCWERATGWLNELAQGTRIFPFQQASDAGRLENSKVTDSELAERNGVLLQASPFFGVRSDRGRRPSEPIGS